MHGWFLLSYTYPCTEFVTYTSLSQSTWRDILWTDTIIIIISFLYPLLFFKKQQNEKAWLDENPHIYRENRMGNYFGINILKIAMEKIEGGSFGQGTSNPK